MAHHTGFDPPANDRHSFGLFASTKHRNVTRIAMMRFNLRDDGLTVSWLGTTLMAEVSSGIRKSQATGKQNLLLSRGKQARG